MINFEDLEIYKTTLEEAKKYHQESIGLTNYEGIQGSDKTYPKMLNFQTILLMNLFEKINSLENKLKNVEDRTLQIINNSNQKQIIEYKPLTFKSW